ncbi:MAG: 4Fe-4S binding protein [Spirochaetes bacterium]|nr:4Fe-4S binding protein [Spirochaetota bacterium]
MLNSVFGSDKTVEYWFTGGIQEAKEGEAVVIANLAGFTPEEAAELAVKAEKAGADMIEVPTHCPHMGEILNAMFPDMNYPEPKLTNLEPMKQSVKMIRSAVKLQVIVKLSGAFSHIVKEWAVGVKESGADGIGCSDALGPGLSIDIKTGQPKLGGPRGVGGVTGPGIMPITLRMVLDAALNTDLPVIGVGGVSSASDVIEYLMAGASLVGVCTAGHVGGFERYTKIIKDLKKMLLELGANSPEDVRGLTLKRIEERKANNRVAVTEPVAAVVDEELCTACGKCQEVCAYDAVISGGKYSINPDACIGCGLCVSICPTEAIAQTYYKL